MGIHDRDYYRDGSRGMFETFGQQGATVWLIAVTSVIFFAQLVTRDIGNNAIDEYGIYRYDRVADGELWRLITSVFLHGSLLHLVFNMLVLYWAGSRLEDRYGSSELLAFYLCAGLFAGTLRFAAEATGLVPPSEARGASGAVTAVLVLYACLYPRQTVRLYFLFPMPVWVLVVIVVGLDALGVVGGGNPQVGYLAHLGGAFFGLLYYQSGRRITDLLPSLPRRAERRAQPRLRVVPQDSTPTPDPDPVGAAVPMPPGSPPDEHLEARVDRILEKVSKHGQESLTEEERELLFRASELYKKRRK